MITPAGLKIQYNNVKFNNKEVQAKVLPTSKVSTIKLPTDKIDSLKTRRSFMPNFIHSLDASNVHLLLKSISNKKLAIYTVHDCFAGTPNNMINLKKLVKKAFIDIYFNKEGYLIKTHKYFIENIKSATDPLIEEHTPLNNNFNGEYKIDQSAAVKEISEPKTLNIIKQEGEKEDKQIQIITRDTKEIINIPNLPTGYVLKNKDINKFIKALLNFKYFIG